METIETRHPADADRDGSDDEVALLGREREWTRIRRLLGHARNGRGGALCLAGDPGIGKTALLDQAARTAATDMRWLRVDGFEAESQLPFAALQRLIDPLRGWLPSLPDRHRGALDVALTLADGTPPDRYLVGLAALGLLAAAAESRPIVCVVDDAHWTDPESLDVLAFVGRRIEAEPIALILAARPGEHVEERTVGLEAVTLEGLAVPAAVELLRRSATDPIDPATAVRIAHASGGNPLALVELPRELTAEQMMESSLAGEPFPVGQTLEEFYVRRIRGLDADVQQWLLVVAADSTGNVDLIDDAASRLGLGRDVVDRAEREGLVQVTDSIHFRHPLVGAAAYNAALSCHRRPVHHALAAAAGSLRMVELEAWHAAKATLGTDPEVAARLENVADLAGRRGGMSSRASVLAQAAALTPTSAQKYMRTVAAAEAALGSGAALMAVTLLDDVDEERLDPVSRGRMVSVRAHHSMFTADPMVRRAGAELLSAAGHFRGHDPDREQAALLQAFFFTLPAERLAEGATLRELGERMLDGASRHDGAAGTVLRGLSAHVLLSYEEAVPLMREAVDAIRSLSAGELLEFGLHSVPLTTALWDVEARSELLERTIAAARDAGSMQVLDAAIWVMSLAELKGGTPRDARRLMQQVGELRRAIGYDSEHVINVGLLAWSDTPRDEVELIAEAAGSMGFGGVQSSGAAGLAVRDLAEGRYADAYQRLRPLIDHPFLQVTPLEYADVIEAGVRSERREEVLPFVGELERMAMANGSSWNLGVARRARALLGDGDVEADFRSAIELLGAVPVEVDLGRAHLLYGEWLRRARRRREAGEQLRLAIDLFDRAEAVAFGRRARHELAAAGHAHGDDVATRCPELTVQEMTVSRLAALGHTNAEIAATMFVSRNTVDYHLRKVFQKLGVSSRRQLADRLP